MGVCTVFCQLFCKNLKTELRSWAKLLFEVLIVVTVSVIITVNFNMHDTGEKGVRSADGQMPLISDEVPIETFEHQWTIDGETLDAYDLVYAPENSIIGKKITNAIKEKLNLRSVIGFKDSKTMEKHFNAKTMMAGLYFRNDPDITIPKYLDVEIRFPAALRTKKDSLPIENRLWTSSCAGARSVDSGPLDVKTVYHEEGFLAVQDEIFRAWVKGLIEEHKNTKVEEPKYSVNVRSFDYKSVYHACASTNAVCFYKFLLAFTFLLPYCNIIWKVARDVENNVLVHHWLYRCPLCFHYAAHFCSSMIRLFVLDLTLILIIKIPFTPNQNHEFQDTGLSNFVFFLVIFNVALILTAFLIASAVYSATTAVLLGIVVWIFMFGVFFSSLLSSRMESAALFYFSIVVYFNSALPYAFQIMKFSPGEDDVEFEYIVVSLIAHMLLVLILLIIRHMVFPLRYLGRNAFKCCVEMKHRRDKSLYSRFILNLRAEDVSKIGFGRLDVNSVLSCKNVTTIVRQKVTKTKEVHIRNVSMTLYPGEITFILGPQGCGKTTMLRLFSGLLQPDYGYIYYNRQALSSNWGKFDQYCDIMMIENHIFDLLSVEETLNYNVRIKGYDFSPERQRDEIRKWLRYLKPIISNPDAYTKRLTFEQKKFICLCCVLSCGTRIVLLDEPDLHIRIKQQQFLWKILRENKEKRTIVITSTDAGAAEQVADRVALFSKGSLKAFGTVTFLKGLLRSNFQLVITKENEIVPTEPITEVLQGLVNTIVLNSEIGELLVYKIPLEKSPLYQKILIELKKEYGRLQIKKAVILDYSFGEVVNQMDVIFSNNDYSATLTGLMSPYALQSNVIRNQQQFKAIFHLKFYQQNYFIQLWAVFIGFFLTLYLSHSLRGLSSIDVEGRSLAPFRLAADPNEFTPILKQDCSYVKMGLVNPYAASIDNIADAECRQEDMKFVLRSGMKNIPYGAIESKSEDSDIDESTIWVNENNFHTAPVSLNLVHNRLLRETFPDDADIAIRASNIPFGPTLRETLDLNSSGFLYLVFPIAVGTVWPIICACYVLFIADTKLMNIYTLLEIAGLSAPVYWTVNFIWDFVDHLICSIIFLLLSALVPVFELQLAHKTVIFLLLIISGIPNIWFVYFIGLFAQHSKNRIFCWACMFSMIFGVLLFTLYWQVGRQSQFVHYLFSIAPQFTLMDAMARVHILSRNQLYCRNKCEADNSCSSEDVCTTYQECCDQYLSSLFTWSHPTICDSLICMAVSTVLFMFLCVLVLLKRRDGKYRISTDLTNYRSYFYDTDDSNVKRLRKYIANLELTQCKRIRVCVDQLEKKVIKKTNRLRTVSFNVDKYSCLCIYGGHHSDKTHMARQLVGDKGFQFGEVYMRGLDLRRDLLEVRKMIGYFPQYGGYYPTITIYQMFHAIYLVRGVPIALIKNRILYLSQLLNLRHLSNKKICDLGELEKRKVKLGIALIALNKILILDEPTIGLDGSGKHEIWFIIRLLCSLGRAIIVFTTDIIECKFLANYVLAVDHYDMLSYGNLFTIYDNNSQGFILKIKVLKEGKNNEEVLQNLDKDFENIKRLAAFFHDNSRLISRNDDTFIFHCPVQNVNFSYLYGIIEKQRARLNIIDYSIEYDHMSDILSKLAKDNEDAKKAKGRKRNYD